MTDDTTTTDTTAVAIPRIMGGANIGGGEAGCFALVALVENADAGSAWLEQMTKQFQQANDAALMVMADAKARLAAREQAVTLRETEAETIMIGLQKQTDLIRSIIS
jgi:hypothetical protein